MYTQIQQESGVILPHMDGLLDGSGHDFLFVQVDDHVIQLPLAHWNSAQPRPKVKDAC